MAESWGPVRIVDGMNLADPAPLRGPGESEQLFNLWYTQARRLARRPGSTFLARAGEGPVLGLHAHSFNAVDRSPVVAAVVGEAYDAPNTLADPAQDGVVNAGQVGIVPDLLNAYEPVRLISARPGDRFTMASTLDLLFVAGSTVDHKLRYYDYPARRWTDIADMRASLVLEYGERLLVAGDPFDPAYLYISNEFDPVTFQLPPLQIGGASSPIRAMAKGAGLALILTETSCWYYLGFAPELGQIDVDEIAPGFGGAGPRAVTYAGDGFFYWLSEEHGPCRWRRGMESVDIDFAARMLPAFQSIASHRAALSEVRWDPIHRAVHYLVPVGNSDVPNYIVSYFPFMGAGGAWTHSVSTTDRSILSDAAGIEIDPASGTPGAELYTCMIARKDPLVGRAQVIVGDGDGIVWYLNQHQVHDKARTEAVTGPRFISVWRSGQYEMAPAGFRSLLQRLGLDVWAGSDYSATFRYELELSGTWIDLATLAASTTDAFPDWQLGGAEGDALADSDPRPRQLEQSVWQPAKIFRFELESDDHASILALEGQHERTAV